MALRAYAVVVALAALVGGVLLLGESPAASPGPVAKGHAELGLECRSCHAPFQGVADGCRSCHGEMAPENAHREAGLACADCHREHRGESVSLNAAARDECETCHAHESIEGVAAHAIGGAIRRPVDLASPRRAAGQAFRAFSHQQHFEETELDADESCQSCHFAGEKAARLKGSEQVIRWSSCEDCHGDGAESDFRDFDDDHPDRERFERLAREKSVGLELDRFERVAFQHSEEHLETDCEGCHSGARAAGAPGADAEEPESAPGAAAVTSCFGCHVHRPEDASWALHFEGAADAESEYAAGSEVACAGCHEFHGKGAEAEIAAADSKTEPREDGWDVLVRTPALSFTPWLLLFVGLGGTGCVFAWRRLPEIRSSELRADTNVAPQRVAEVPMLSPTGESSVAGLYIIGELAGIPLVNRAMKSGFDVADVVANKVALGEVPQPSDEDDGRPHEERLLDLVIVGSGPAGLGAATRAQSIGLSYVVCEKSTPAATIRDYPRAKIIQAAPVEIPDYGSFFQEDDESKEALVRRWEDIISRTGVVVREREEVVDIQAIEGGGFEVEVAGGKVYRANHVVLAIGMRGSPRRLRVEGETSDRVAYNLIDAEEFREKRLLVVGGGNAAVEAALALSQPELLNTVHLAIRGPVLKGITPQNSQDVDEAAAEGRIEIVPSSSMNEIRDGVAVLDTPEGPVELPNDLVFALIGAELPIPFLRKIGVRLGRKGL